MISKSSSNLEEMMNEGTENNVTINQASSFVTLVLQAVKKGNTSFVGQNPSTESETTSTWLEA
ncbi:hypothetical protein Hanom_Chr03g00277421 [Helianthus anomalus]